jgi:hypothetical protein
VICYGTGAPFASAMALQGAMEEECVSLISPKSQISVCSRDAQVLRSEEMSVAGKKVRFDIVGDVRIGSYRVQLTRLERQLTPQNHNSSESSASRFLCCLLQTHDQISRVMS